MKGNAPVLLMYPVCFIVKVMSRSQASYYLFLGISGTMVVCLRSSMFKNCSVVVECKFPLSWSICASAMYTEGGKKKSRLVELISVHVSKFPLFIARMNVLGVKLKQQPWIYWNSSVFVLYFLMISCEWWWKGLEMGISQRPSWWFLWPFKMFLLFLKILIPFLSQIVKQS